MEYFNRALQISPGFIDAIFNKIAVLHKQGKADEALGELLCIEFLAENQKYLKFVRVVMRSSVEKIANHTDDAFRDSILKLNNEPEILYQLFKKCRRTTLDLLQ